jgi:predicted DNA-binding protein (UPF0251 family)
MPEEAPALAGWVTCTQAAEMLGITRQSVNKAVNAGEFKTLHRLGERPIFVIKTNEVSDLVNSGRFAKKPAS